VVRQWSSWDNGGLCSQPSRPPRTHPEDCSPGRPGRLSQAVGQEHLSLGKTAVQEGNCKVLQSLTDRQLPNPTCKPHPSSRPGGRHDTRQSGPGPKTDGLSACEH